jgi:hypothetical protein
MEAKTSSRQKRVTAPKQRQKTGDRVKTTIVMDSDLDFRLGANAEFQKMDRSSLAAKLIDQGLRALSFDKHLRAFTESANESGELNLAAQNVA